MNKIDDYLTVSEASKVLGISMQTLRNWEKRGKISVYRNPINSYRLYLKVEIEKILAEINSNFFNKTE